jgi:hypothetical protein
LVGHDELDEGLGHPMVRISEVLELGFESPVFRDVKVIILKFLEASSGSHGILGFVHALKLTGCKGGGVLLLNGKDTFVQCQESAYQTFDLFLQLLVVEFNLVITENVCAFLGVVLGLPRCLILGLPTDGDLGSLLLLLLRGLVRGLVLGLVSVLILVRLLRSLILGLSTNMGLAGVLALLLIPF